MMKSTVQILFYLHS